MVVELDDVDRIGARDQYLAVLTVLRPDGTPQSTVVNAGLVADPLTGERSVAVVLVGGARKLKYLRRQPRATVTFRAGWQWASVEGPARLVGPDDPADGVDPERLRLMLREVFTAAGGTHDDWAEYDRVMAAERRTVLLVRPDRIYGT